MKFDVGEIRDLLIKKIFFLGLIILMIVFWIFRKLKKYMKIFLVVLEKGVNLNVRNLVLNFLSFMIIKMVLWIWKVLILYDFMRELDLMVLNGCLMKGKEVKKMVDIFSILRVL